MEWIQTKVHFQPPAQEIALTDYVHQVEHLVARIERLDWAVLEAARSVPPPMRAVIEALQALRGIAQVTTVTIVAEPGQISRFARARQLMGYSGLVPSEDSSGERKRRGAITQTGNAHLRRVIVEAPWAYPFRPWLGGYLLKRQVGLSEEVKEIAWNAQHRLHSRYLKLLARKEQTADRNGRGRELLGFVWAIGVKVETRTREQKQVAA
ncbi:MAG: transposase [Candidatus Acidiferrales bacterium]